MAGCNGEMYYIGNVYKRYCTYDQLAFNYNHSSWKEAPKPCLGALDPLCPDWRIGESKNWPQQLPWFFLKKKIKIAFDWSPPFYTDSFSRSLDWSACGPTESRTIFPIFLDLLLFCPRLAAAPDAGAFPFLAIASQSFASKPLLWHKTDGQFYRAKYDLFIFYRNI